jgi:hypothetical protein
MSAAISKVVVYLAFRCAHAGYLLLAAIVDQFRSGLKLEEALGAGH